MPYHNDIEVALNRFKALRVRWAAVAQSGQLDMAARQELSNLLTAAKSSVMDADPHVITAREGLPRPGDHTRRRQATRSITSNSDTWDTEVELLRDYVPAGTLNTYRRRVKKIFRAEVLPALPLASPAPVAELVNRLSTPGPNQRILLVGPYVQRQLRAIDAILIILANTQSPNSKVRFEVSFVLSTTVSLLR